MSDTPRTDKEIFVAVARPDVDLEAVDADFARTLERENAVLRADRDRLDWLEGEDGQSWTAKWYYWGEEWINRAAIDAAMKEVKP